MADSRAADQDGQSLELRISNAVVGLHKRYYGKGPTRARTHLLGDLVVCVLRGGLTTLERTLVDEGRGTAVAQQRAEFQEVVKGKFKASVEEITGRRVLGFTSGNDEEAELMTEVFLLEPAETRR